MTTYLKQIFIVVLFLIIGSSLSGQQELPNSRLNLSLGYGSTFGGIGTKAVLGSRNTGFLLSVGYPWSDVPFAFNLGFQIAVNEVFANVSYGYVGSNIYEDGSKEAFIGGSFVIGGMLNLNQTKRAFLEISVGSSFGVTKEIWFEKVKNNFIIVNIGLGYRFGTKKYDLLE